MFFFFLTTVCVKLLGLYLPLYMFCCMRAGVSGLMALLVLCFFPLNIFIHSFIQAANLSDCRIESEKNRFGSENRIESNRNFFARIGMLYY